jgi:hypothetical protein
MFPAVVLFIAKAGREPEKLRSNFKHIKSMLIFTMPGYCLTKEM